MPEGDIILRRNFPLNPGDCHPITFLGFLRSSSERKREYGRVDAIMVSGGQSLRGWEEEDGRKKQERGSENLPAGLPPFINSYDIWKYVVRDAWSPHPPPRDQP
jgi:hypothetical protein